MLSTSLKKEWIQIINTIEQLHHKGLLGRNQETVLYVLQECQEAAISVGESIEKAVIDEKQIITMLETYCEELYQAANQIRITENVIMKLDALLDEVRNAVNQIPSKYQVVFFPYKAAMWDSLESIWQACKEDWRCECIVVPIPYFRFDSENKRAVYCYEGDMFPEYVPIKYYKEYSVELEKPDIAYIHNPYDKQNLVTSVAPDYYSFNLKKYVNKLVYVPYYVSAGTVSERQREVSVYYNMDYMVAQSKQFKEGFRGLPYYDKLLPLGSPKFDRVINKCREGVEQPIEWKRVIKGKKTLMLNTSINCFLSQGEFLITKLKNIFEWIKEYEKIALIWRPHPLLEATIDSMRPQLREQYHTLVDYFEQEQIGIIDNTPDVTKTIAIVDGYIGEVSSSLVYLFGAAGKPVFILNNFIIESYSSEERRRVLIGDMVEIGGYWWLTSFIYNGLFCMKPWDWNGLEFIGRVDKQLKWSSTCISLINTDNDIYLAPYDSTMAVKYNTCSKKYSDIGEKQNKKINAKKIIPYKNKIFYVLNYDDAILEYDVKLGTWKRYDEIFATIKKEMKEPSGSNMWDCDKKDNLLWITTHYSNKVLLFDMENGSCSVLEVGDASLAYSGIVCDGDNIYLAEVHSGSIFKINMVTEENHLCLMPEGFCIMKNIGSEAIAHTKLIDMGEWILTVPYNGNCMVKMSKATGESHLFIPEFWEKANDIANGYNPYFMSAAFFAKKIDDKHLIIQRLCDGAVASIDVETENYVISYPEIDEKMFEKFMEKQDGFEKNDESNSFVCRESALFSLEKFVDDLVNDKLENVKKRQMEELACMAENLDGCCGEKVHKYMMEMLEKEE